MSTRTYRRRILAGAGALTLALTGGVAGLAGSAQAATKTTAVFVNCDAPAPQPDGSGDQNFTVTLPDGAKAGDLVDITIDPGASPLLPQFAVTSTNTTKMTLKVGGTTQTVTSPPETVDVTPGVPLDPAAFTGKITVPDGTEGTTVNVTIDLSVTDAVVFGSTFTTTCTPEPRPSAPVGSIAVEDLPAVPVTTRLTPSSGGPDTVVAAEGANFPPGAVTCAASLSGTDTGDTGTGTANAAGAASCEITLTKKADNVRIGSTDGKRFTWIQPAEGVAHPVDIEVLPGPLALGPTAGLPTLDFGAVTINGKAQSVTGSFHAATVQDFRGGSLGWDLTVTRTPFLNQASGHSMDGAQLGIQPTCNVTNPDSPSACTAGAPGAITDTPMKVASQAAGGDQLTGGEFAVGGGAMIQLPPFMFADTYQSIVTFSIA
ncbi:WxL domain-containing protein [Streptomyces sp. NPDC006879]|uniref:WxL domain-containing protein n=1 Tax=Streptomyces sp. NPDC006879 TaxID=3364767 RepID=UPI003693E1C6